MYEVKSSNDATRGRYVVASRDISKGESLLHDLPYVLVPSLKSHPVCIQCFRTFEFEEALPRCDSCGFPLCPASGCDELLYNHSLEECSALSRLPVKPIFQHNTISPLYTALGPLRLLLRSRNDPEGFESRIQSLMGHEDSLEKQHSGRSDYSTIVGFIQKSLGFGEFSSLEIIRSIGIIKTNSVKLDTRRSFRVLGMGLYPNYSLFNHSCLPNTRTRKLENGTLELYAILNISKGEEIYTRYVTPQLGTFRRQQLLQTNWHFACACRRCSDPTEFGTHLNTLSCDACPGILLPENPLDLKSNWNCSNCESQKDHGRVSRLLFEYNILFERCQKHPQRLEELLDSELYAKPFHRNHFLNIGIKERIVHTLINAEKRGIKDPKLVQKKVKYFEDIANVLSLVDLPGDIWTKPLEKMKAESVYYDEKIKQDS
eukprot:TRINITY_DN4904_c0_g1_i1.p1 TRINITY_DN4904_c0_g1~~TRINITY_DN4904_c0_g1_i1.p1  ORF type:complete len:441 (+),score=50.23 TRINITY_DN4904_c0_g1_i1:35-1324(+)